MDVRKWTERQTDKVWELCQHSDRDICPACVADAFAPTITKLVEALRLADKMKMYQPVGCAQYRREMCELLAATQSALAELEKP